MWNQLLGRQVDHDRRLRLSARRNGGGLGSPHLVNRPNRVRLLVGMSATVTRGARHTVMVQAADTELCSSKTGQLHSFLTTDLYALPQVEAAAAVLPLGVGVEAAAVAVTGAAGPPRQKRNNEASFWGPQQLVRRPPAPLRQPLATVVVEQATCTPQVAATHRSNTVTMSTIFVVTSFITPTHQVARATFTAG